jgi:hypothetical protein
MLEAILIVLAFIAIIGVGIYFYMEMKDHKETNNNDFEKVSKTIDDEKKVRLGNIKYVVDQVNETNEEMDTLYTKRFDEIEKSTTGFGKLIKTGDSNSDVKDVTDPQSINLMKRVSVIGGMTIKDLQSTTPTSITQFKACGAGTNATQCIEFPDSNGNTVLKGITGSNSSVVSKSLFKADAGAIITGDLQVDNIKPVGLTTDMVFSTGTNNEIKVLQNAGGITITSGTNKIGINSTGINITTAEPTVAGDTIEYPININNTKLKTVSVGSDNVNSLLNGKKVLYL